MKIPEPKKAKSKKSVLLYGDTYYEDLLTSFFRLDFDLELHYQKWKECHKHFETNVTDKYQNIRQLNIDVVENLFSFICSQNNHITRISSLVNKLCINYGEKICEVDGQEYFAFPALTSLAKDGVEENLRVLGFGYRAKYIQKSAQEILAKGGLKWFQEVSEMNYGDAHKELMSLSGIGPKVADCICLMSCNHLSAVPVDTHIIQIAKHYLPEVANIKSMTPTIYKKIGDEFRRVYGEYSGWAQTVLFIADLSGFKEKLESSKSKKQKKS
jgi:N-glycosylase/DNA lyase